MKQNSPLLLSVLIILAAAFIADAQRTADLPKGVVIPKVQVAEAPDHNYALYLPTAYDAKKKWPVLFIFDPVARGTVALEHFREAAEKRGYILIASNNSQNGVPATELQKIFIALWDDSHQRYSLDDRRVYAAGFSGGARVASLMASVCKSCIAGIVGCGAAFSTYVKPSTDQSFIWFGTVGLDDFNYPELIGLEKTLKGVKVPARLETFAGKHQWLPAALAETAFEWFDLQSMQKGTLLRDDAFISAQFAVRKSEAESLLAQKDTVAAYRAYTDIVADFQGLADTGDAAKQVSTMTDSPELKRGYDAEKRDLARQEEIYQTILQMSAKIDDPETGPNALGDMRSYIRDLKSRRASTPDGTDHVTYRALSEVFVYADEAAVFADEPAGKYDVAIAHLMLADEVIPKQPDVHFELAKCYALRGVKGKAVDELKLALDLGLADRGAIKTEPAFQTLKSYDRYQKLVADLDDPANKK